jgi:FKBP-type peptidyl-prolyl cis-trans isomerase
MPEHVSHPVNSTERGLVRRAPALLVAAALLLVSLTACSTNPNANCSTAATPGTASNLISVSGKFGEKPTVKIPTPLATTTTQATTTITGSGAPIEKNQEILMDYSIFNGRTGKLVQASSYTKAGDAAVVVGTSIKGLNKALLCSQVGSRLAIAMAPSDGFGASGTSAGISAKDSVVMVVDVMKAYLPRANGAPQVHQPGFPFVALAPTGQPGVTIPTTDPPKDLKISVLKAGSGQVVKRGDNVVTNYTGLLWKERTVFDSTWNKGQPATLKASTGSGGVVPGFASAIIGQKVGSQILVIVPPAEGYGAKGNSSASIPGNSTLVFVIDILGIQ